MNVNNAVKIIPSLLMLILAPPLNAEMDWMTATFDNDLFVGNDNGYTNGLYISFYDIGQGENKIPKHDFWVKPLKWSIPESGIESAVNAYMIGQTISTPSDISVAVPNENELPYSALLAFTNSYLTVTPTYADSISTSIGIVGPAALGEEAQKLIHNIIGADEPQGWDTQLRNEIVFQFSRARIWRNWKSDSGHFDFLTNIDLDLGTIQSSVSSGMIFRYGRNLANSYATTLLYRSRTTNPAAVNGGWYFYNGIQTGYIFNQIFTDGNTFRDSRSIDINHEFIGLTAGFAYAWKNYSLTIAVNDSNILERLENLTQYGTITFAWQI